MGMRQAVERRKAQLRQLRKRAAANTDPITARGISIANRLDRVIEESLQPGGAVEVPAEDLVEASEIIQRLMEEFDQPQADHAMRVDTSQIPEVTYQ